MLSFRRSIPVMLRNQGSVGFLRYVVAVVSLTLLEVATAWAAPINYGDFAGQTVSFLQVTESAISAGDATPLFGAPEVIGDQLDFDPQGFSAVGINGSSDVTAGQLNFTLMSKFGRAITELAVAEGGDYTLFGNGTAATNVGFSISVPMVTVLEVDRIPISPVALNPSAASGGAALPGNLGTATWSLSSVYDMNAALTAAGVPFVWGATKVEVAVQDMLSANSEPGTIAAIAKKDFVVINASTVAIPEPTTPLLLALLGGGCHCLRRRR